MRSSSDWNDGNYMEWADQERLVRQDLEEIDKDLKRRKAENYRTVEFKDDKHGCINITG